MNLNTFARIEELLADLNFFTGADPQMILGELDRDMKDYEIMYTLEDLLERVIEKLQSEGRTYSMPDAIGSVDRSSRDGYFG